MENLSEQIIAENFPNLVKEAHIQVQGAQRAPNKMNPERPTSRHIIMKTLKVKGKKRLLKAVREKQLVTDKEISIKLSAYFQQKCCRPEGSGTVYST